MDRYEVPIDPYNVVWADPQEISYKTERERPRWASFVKNLGSVKRGDWDVNAEEGFSFRHQSFKDHFEQGVAWEKTEFYQRSIDAIANGEYGMRMSTSKEEVLERCREIDELYETIRTEGYKTQEDLKTYDSMLDRLAHEIQIDIGRDGSLLFVEGRHRLSIAKILGIEEVPIVIVCRHEQWVERLENRYRRGDRLDHPDWENVKTNDGA